MDSPETRIENAAEQTAAAVTETAAAAAEAVTPVAEAAAEKTEEAVADIGETAAAAVTETLATTSEPPAADTAAAPMDPTLLGAAIAGIVVLVIVIAALARRKKGGKAPSAKSNGSGGNGSMVEIYVGNLSYDMNDAQLRREFERFGVVKSARVITNRSNNKSKGYGFVEMPHRKEALIAIKALDNSEVMARRIRVNEARANTKPPEDR
ncbi:MAG: hypothetical protein PHW08_04430 [Kiritimatiellae bacterium]|nr:hypothetical protein [Kiritimatiellia bacterium]